MSKKTSEEWYEHFKGQFLTASEGFHTDRVVELANNALKYGDVSAKALGEALNIDKKAVKPYLRSLKEEGKTSPNAGESVRRTLISVLKTSLG